MNIATYEGIVENGQIKLKSNIRLPENAIVYVVVPDRQVVHMYSPRLAHPEEAASLRMKIIEEGSDAGL
jgi:hypothetical protein